MNGNAIGSAGSPIDTLTIASGVLRNVGEINGGADWNKTGTGTLTIGGTNSFSGTLNVVDGVVRYDGYHNSPGLITVQGGGMLMGTGRVDQIWVYSGGVLSPGHSPGTLTAAGDVAFTSGAEFEVELLGPMSGQYDQLLMQSGSTLTLGGATLSVIAPNALPYGTVFPIVSGWGSISGTFLGLSDGDTFTGGVNEFQINYGTLPGYTDDVTLMVVPEPGTLATLTLALAVGAVLRRRLRH
jgi:autotransporter-associated beta strand protein